MQDVTQRPLPGTPTRWKRFVLGFVASLVAASLLGSAFAPVLLLKAPLLLVALAPDARHLALAVGSVAPVLLVSVAVLRRVLYSAGSFGLGVFYGGAGVRWLESRSPRAGKFVRLIERLFARWGAAIVVVWPHGSTSMLAGASGTRLWVFLAAASLGHTLWVLSVYAIGEFFADFVQRVLAFLSNHLVESTLVCVGIVVLHQIVSRRHRPAP